MPYNMGNLMEKDIYFKLILIFRVYAGQSIFKAKLLDKCLSSIYFLEQSFVAFKKRLQAFNFVM